MVANKKRVLCIFGTRPESIKLFPVVQQLQKSLFFTPTVACVYQQPDLLKHTVKYFNETSFIEVSCCRESGDLIELTTILLEKLSKLLIAEKPDLILIQGDTSTAFCASLAAFYLGIPVGHIEAGLRTYNPMNPYPEEAHRSMITNLARWHFCPSPIAYNNILKQGVQEDNIVLCGNTVIDALQSISPDLNLENSAILAKKPFFVITVHRRENRKFIPSIFEQLITSLLNTFLSHQIIWVTHPSWSDELVNTIFPHEERLLRIPPLSYEQFIGLLQKADVVLTDSGGVQEEITTLGIPGIVLREITDRPESQRVDFIKISGWSIEQITRDVSKLLQNKSIGSPFKNNLFGDGNAAEKIVGFLEKACFD